MAVLLFLIALQVEPIRLPADREAAAKRLLEYASHGRAAEALVEAAGFDARGVLKHPTLRREDLEPIAPFALEEKPDSKAVLDAVDRWALKSAAPRLVTILQGKPEPEIQLRAACTLARWSTPELLPLLVRKGWGFVADPELNTLAHRTEWTLKHVAAGLVGTPEAAGTAKAIHALLQSRSASQKEAAVLILVILGSPGLSRELGALSAPDQGGKLRTIAVEALGELGALDQQELLRKHLQEPWPNLQMEAARALFRMGAPDAAKDMAALLGHEGYARDMVLEALAESDPVPLLAPLSARGDLEALGGLRLPQLAPLLLKGLESPDLNIRLKAIRGLGFHQDPTLAPKLLPFLKDAKAKPFATSALVRLRSPLLLSEAAPQDAEDLRALGAVGDRSALPKLKPFLTHASRDFRMKAVRAAGAIGGPDAAAALLPLLDDPDRYVRGAVIRELGDLGAREALPALQKQRTAPDPYLRLSLDTTLCLLGERDAAAGMIEGMRKEGWNGWMLPLNVLRNPAAWKALAEHPSGGDLSGSAAEILGRLAQEAGVELELPDPPLAEPRRWLNSRQSRRTLLFTPPRPNASVRDVLLCLLSYSPFDLIVEDGKIRILERLDSQRFWEHWEHDTRPR